MNDLRYSKDDVWMLCDDIDIATVGVSNHAQREFGDIIAVELPELDRSLEEGEDFAIIESANTTIEVVVPVAGRVIAINDVVLDKPDEINRSPEDDAWLIRMVLSSDAHISELMDEEEYAEYCASR